MDVRQRVGLVRQHGVLGPLRELGLGLHVSCLQLSLEPGHLLHVAFGELLESHLIVLGDCQLLFLLFELPVEVLDAPIQLGVLLFEGFRF